MLRVTYARAHDPLPLPPRARDNLPMQLQVFRQYASRCAHATPPLAKLVAGRFLIFSVRDRERNQL